MEEEALDEFGRPLRPNRDSSSDSDSDREYDNRYRKRRDSRERDFERYSPDSRGYNSRGGGGGGGGRGDHSPERRRRSPSPYRGSRGNGSRGVRDDHWDNNNNNGYRGSGRNGFPSMPMEEVNGTTTSTSSSAIPSIPQQAINKSIPKRIQKRGDIFEGGYFRSYKQFLDYQDDSITPGEADKKYEEYKIEYSKRQSRIFFKEHQTEEWFKEKYDPFFLAKKRKEKVEKSKSFISTFSLNLNDENHKFSLESKDNIKKGDKLDLDGLDMHHHLQHQQNEENNNNGNTTTTTTTTTGDEEDKSTTGGDDKMDEDKANKTTTTNQDKEKSTLFIKAVSPTCTKDELLEVLNRVGGGETVVTKLTLSEPVRYKNFYRLGWVTFKNSEIASKALKELNGFKMKDFDLYLNINKPSEDAERRFKITPNIASTENRITIDLEQSSTLMKLFDDNKGITNNPINSFEKWDTLSTIEKLDRVILYLRYVHFYCYYCSEEFSDECETTRKCGTIHLRRSPGEQTSIIPNNNSINNNINNTTTSTSTTTTTTTTTTSENEEDKIKEKIEKIKETTDNNDDNKEDRDKEDKDNKEDNKEEKDDKEEQDKQNNGGEDQMDEDKSMLIDSNKSKLTSESEHLWVTSLDSNTKNKIAKIPTSEEQYTCKESIEKAVEEYITTNTIKIEEEKFKCSLCSKLFKGAEYVKKHINLKHPEELNKDSESKGTEEQFFLNYFSDPRRITPLPPQNQMVFAGPYGNGVGAPGSGIPMQIGGRPLPPGATQLIPGHPRARFNPQIGQWETVVVPMMMPGMNQQPIIMSPVFASPNGIRGGRPGSNGNGVVGVMPPHHMVIQQQQQQQQQQGVIPMRRSYPGSNGGGGNLSPGHHGGRYGGPSGGMDQRYRPYPQQPPRHSSSGSMDPRGIREYVDLDAPVDHVPEIDYRSALKEYQNKKSL